MRNFSDWPTVRRAGAVVLVLGLLTSVVGAFSPATAAAGDPVVTLENDINGCNGVRPTEGGSENTTKRLDPDFPSDFNPGGTVGFIIDYPVTATDVSGRTTFVITDCVFVDDVAVAKYSVSFVPNTEEFVLRFAVPIAPGTLLGAQFCNYAKTTAAPSDSPASNRKAGPACFTVGGALRIEKRSGSVTGPVLGGASFNVVCSPAVAVPPTVITGLSTTSHSNADGTVSASGVSAVGSIAINGPSGTPCTVTETAAPEGYQVDSTPRNLVIPVGTAQTVNVFVNRQVGALLITKATTGGTGTFTFDLDCDGTAFDQALTIDGTGSQTVLAILTGTQCKVTERGSALFTSTSIPADATVTIGAGITVVAFTNTAKPTGITLDKKLNGDDHATVGDALVVHPGDQLTYTVTIQNNGLVPLTLSSLSDSLEPGFAAACSQGVGSTLAAGASFTCTYQRTATSSATNTAAVVGVDGLGRQSNASDSTFVKVINPAISITKTANPVSVSPGGVVTFTYTVTNRGDTTLTEVAVTDDILGSIGVIGTLAPGVSATLTKTQTVQASTPSRNIGTVTGTDVLGRKVTASATAEIAIVLGVVLERPASLPLVQERQPNLPRTGGQFSVLALGGLALVLLGLVILLGGGKRARMA